MSFETKEQVLEKIMDLEKPKCPDCSQEMVLWEVPELSFGDGLGWGVPYLFVCFNDSCPTYTSGWDDLAESVGHKATYRNICYPGKDNFECMPVFSSQGGTGQITTDASLARQEGLKEATKLGFSLLADLYNQGSWFEVLKLLLDPSLPARVRQKAAEMVGDMGELDAIEPLKNIATGNQAVDQEVAGAVKKIHERFYTTECPSCAEIIKKRAKTCKHCGQEL